MSRITPVSYVVFDLLFLSKRPLMAEPLSERREALVKLYEQFPLPDLLLSEGFPRCGRELFAQVVRLGLEGMMAKLLDAPYLSGKRSRHWLKIKPNQSAAKQRLVRQTSLMNATGDETEEIRRNRLAVINSAVESHDPMTERRRLEPRYGQVWDTSQLAEDFEVLGFMAPYAVVRRRSDWRKGSLEFQHQPRFSFNSVLD